MKTKRLMFMLAICLALPATAMRAGELLLTNRCPMCSLMSEPPDHYTDKSLYQLESQWTTDAGKPIKLGELAGKPQVVLMFFSRCTTACPILMNDLKRISAALTPEQRAKVGFTMVSFDTEHDTPAALAEYRRAWELPADNWTLLNGKPDDVLELAALLGVKYKQDANGQFAHSNVISVLNARGEIAYQQTGLNADVDETVQTLAKLVKN